MTPEEKNDQRGAGPEHGHELDAFLGKAFEEKPLWADLWESVRDVFFPVKLPPLQLTSTPIPVPDRMAVKPNPWAIGISTTVNLTILLIVLFFVGKKVMETVKQQALNVNIDITAPTVTADAPSGWSAVPVTVQLHPADTGGSGATSTQYRLHGATGWTSATGDAFTVPAPSDGSNDGAHVYDFQAFDAARVPYYGYGTYPNVYTALEVERLRDPEARRGDESEQRRVHLAAERIGGPEAAGRRDARTAMTAATSPRRARLAPTKRHAHSA